MFWKFNSWLKWNDCIIASQQGHLDLTLTILVQKLVTFSQSSSFSSIGLDLRLIFLQLTCSTYGIVLQGRDGYLQRSRGWIAISSSGLGPWLNCDGKAASSWARQSGRRPKGLILKELHSHRVQTCCEPKMLHAETDGTTLHVRDTGTDLYVLTAT